VQPKNGYSSQKVLSTTLHFPFFLSHQGVNVLPGGYKVKADKCSIFVVVEPLDKYKGLA